jgi:ketosteroid isomerase-like protein
MATLVTPIQQAVTGDEFHHDQADPLQALAMFYRAFNKRDLALMEQNWDPTVEAALDNPLGGIKRGWREIKTVYERIFSSEARVEVEFYDYTMHGNDNVFFVVGRERGMLKSPKGTLALSIRTSRIFRRAADGRWRQIHHHGSFDDHSFLSKYQQMVG